MTTKYDPEILQNYVDQLYSQASWVLARTAILGFVAGWVGDFLLFSLTRGATAGHASAFSQWVLPLIGLIVGYLYGSGRAFQLRLEAQRTLCHLQIERNTHASISAPSTTAPAG